MARFHRVDRMWPDTRAYAMHGKGSYVNSGERLLVPAVRSRVSVVVLDLAISGPSVHAVRLDEARMSVETDSLQAACSGAPLELAEDPLGDAGAALSWDYVHPLDLRDPSIQDPERAGPTGSWPEYATSVSLFRLIASVSGVSGRPTPLCAPRSSTSSRRASTRRSIAGSSGGTSRSSISIVRVDITMPRVTGRGLPY